jgi:hypothetical protein
VVQEQQQQQQQQQLSTAGTSQAQPLWSRPQGRVSIAAVVSEGEKVRCCSALPIIRWHWCFPLCCGCCVEAYIPAHLRHTPNMSPCAQAGTFSPASHPGAHTLLWLDPSALLQRTQTPGPGASASDGSDALVIAEALGKQAQSNGICPVRKVPGL